MQENMQMRKAAVIFLFSLTAALSGCGGTASGAGNGARGHAAVSETGQEVPVGETHEADLALSVPAVETHEADLALSVPAVETHETDPGSDSPQQEDASQAQKASVRRTAVEEQPGMSAPEPFVDKLTPEGKGWGLAFGEPGEQPVGNVSVEELAQYDAYYMGDDSEKVVYLTFDCGYENGNTEAILDALKEHDAPATFFVVGYYLETAPELVCRMVEEGHAVGSHTYHHPDINTLPDIAAFQEEMDSLKELFTQVTGAELDMYYRPPEGKCGIDNLKMARELGYHTIFWSLAHVDWDVEKQPSREQAIEKLTERVHPGAVVLLHNTSRTNGEILDELLTKWEEMGYRFAPLSELTAR